MIFTGIALILWFGFYLWYFLAFNHLVALRNTVAQTWAHVDVELQRRYDLIGNLVNVVKAYTRHEGDTLLATVQARAGGINVHDANLATRQDSALLANILLLVERYPELKADQHFQSLQQELIATENRIATRRNAYNECVSRYETGRSQFPALVIAWAGHFAAAEFFDAQDETAHAVQVMLS